VQHDGRQGHERKRRPASQASATAPIGIRPEEAPSTGTAHPLPMSCVARGSSNRRDRAQRVTRAGTRAKRTSCAPAKVVELPSRVSNSLHLLSVPLPERGPRPQNSSIHRISGTPSQYYDI
jgi:hypothetical protein